MLRLVIDNNDVELYEDAPVNLKFQFSDVEKVNNPLASFSQSFRVPLTRKNVNIFGHLDQVTEVGGLDLRQRLSAQLLSDTFPIMDGYVQVKGVYLTKEIYPEVDLVFFSGVSDLKSELGNKFLTDLDLTEYNHTVNFDNVEDTRFPGAGIAPEIVYGLMDKGDAWTSSDMPWTSTDGIEQNRLTIYLQAYAIFEKIMDEAGFTFESDFVEGGSQTTFGRLYLPLANGERFIQPEGEYAEDLRVALPTSGQTLTTTTTTRIAFSESQANCYDEGDNYLIGFRRYDAPATARYTIRLTYSFLNPSGHTITLKLIVGSTTEQTITTSATSGFNLTANKIVDASVGDDIYYRAYYSGSGGDQPVLYGTGDFSSGANRTSMEIVAGPPKSGFTAGIKENLPEMKQIDFITSLQKMFNLVFVPDPVRPNHIEVQTFNDFIASGAEKNWSTKVDYSKDVSIRPTTDLQKDEYIWTYTDGTDLVNKAVKESLDRTYGRFRLLDNSNEFTTGTQTFKVNFAPHVSSLIPGTEWPVMRLIKPDPQTDQAEIKKPKPMLCFRNYNSVNYGTWYVRDDSNVTQSIPNFNFFSNYSSSDPSVDDMDLNFGMEQPLFDIAANPSKTLYFEYWAQYVVNLYSADSRIMECHIRLNAADRADFKFNDKIYIKDTFYRVLSLSYDANVEGIAKVTLIRVFEDVQICADTPTDYNAEENAVTFNNDDDDYGSEACCELYGYDWGGTRCRPKNSILEI